MKKLLIASLALALLSLTACSTGFVRSTTPATEAPAATEAATAAPTEAPTAQPTDAPAEIEATKAPAN